MLCIVYSKSHWLAYDNMIEFIDTVLLLIYDTGSVLAGCWVDLRIEGSAAQVPQGCFCTSIALWVHSVWGRGGSRTGL